MVLQQAYERKDIVPPGERGYSAFITNGEAEAIKAFLKDNLVQSWSKTEQDYGTGSTDLNDHSGGIILYNGTCYAFSIQSISPLSWPALFVSFIILFKICNANTLWKLIGGTIQRNTLFSNQ
jgi:hypothetical protein